MHSQEYLNNYFKNFWKGYTNSYIYSGISLATKIKPNEWVIDVGCGTNPFKPLIKNLVGIDPAFDQADYQVTIENFDTKQKFDVAFCLGSINFGNEKNILNQIEYVIKLLKPNARIYWRVNPGRKDHGNQECNEIDFFPWSKELLVDYANQFGFVVSDLKDDSNNRIYCEWTRSNT